MRSDTRLTMDIGKITCLRNNQYKYIYFYDDNYEVLIDLINDPKELTNLATNKDNKSLNYILNKFRKYFEGFESDLYNFHLEELKNNALNNFTSLKTKLPTNSIKILVVSKAPSSLIDILFDSLNNIYSNIEQIDIVEYGGMRNNQNQYGEIYTMDTLNSISISKSNLCGYDLVVYLTENSRRVFLKPEIYKAVKSINANELLLLNFNFEVFDYFKSRWYPNGAKLFFSWSRKGFIYKEEPLTFIKDVYEFFKISFKFIFNKGTQSDQVAAKEIYEYRNHQLKMGDGHLDDEIKREIKNIENWSNE